MQVNDNEKDSRQIKDRLFTIDMLKGNNYLTRTTKLGNKIKVRKKVDDFIIIYIPNLYPLSWPTEKQIYKTKDPEIIEVYELIDSYNHNLKFRKHNPINNNVIEEWYKKNGLI